MKSEILKIDPVKPEHDRIARAAKVIKGGGLVVFPTETVYGIGANAFDKVACKKIFEAKGRPVDNPLIVTVCSIEQAKGIAEIPDQYTKAIEKAWPSPISFIVKLKADLPKEVTAGLDTVTLRMPAHPVALALIKEAGTPLAAPSANPSKKPTATNAEQARRYFEGKVDCIIDSGDSFFGIESTILDLRDFTILRPGPFTTDELKKVFGKEPRVTDVSKGLKTSDVAVSPGTKYKHYAPDTPLFLFLGNGSELVDELSNMTDLPDFAFIGSTGSCREASDVLGCSTVDLGESSDMYQIARNLYNSLILLDSMKVGFGVIESFDERGISLAIMNRIRKASSHNSFSNADGLASLIEKHGIKAAAGKV